jgi:alpha-tubulin suppressor-like RCC1 family protein
LGIKGAKKVSEITMVEVNFGHSAPSSIEVAAGIKQSYLIVNCDQLWATGSNKNGEILSLLDLKTVEQFSPVPYQSRDSLSPHYDYHLEGIYPG